MGNILVTAKADPDLDGTACMLAYADLLNQSGQTAEGIPFGSLSIETQFFTSSQDVSISTRLNDGTGDWDKFILVDASSMAGMPKVVKSENVIEVIDHRPGTPEVEFPNAKIQNDLIGSAATLIVERFKNAVLLPSVSNAKLLYGAIFENTLNFSSSNTDSRDNDAAIWLEQHFNLTRNIISDMYDYSTTNIIKNINKPLVEDSKVFATSGGSWVMCQLVTHGADLKAKEQDIEQAITSLQSKSGSKFGFLNSIDLEKKVSNLYTSSHEAKEMLGHLFKVSFQGNWGTLSPMLLRKQIFSKVNLYLENQIENI